MTDEEVLAINKKYLRRKRIKNIVIFLSIVILVVLIAEFSNYRESRSPGLNSVQTENLASNITILYVKGSWGKYGSFLNILSEVKNGNSKPVKIKVTAIARDASGQLVATDDIWLNDAEYVYPNQTAVLDYPLTQDRSAEKLELRILTVRD